MGKFLELKRNGASRLVILISDYAIKIPQLCGYRNFLWGLLANHNERRFAATKWPELCPVLISDPLGFCLVMPRIRPLSNDEWANFDFEAFCNKPDYVVCSEEKQDSFGWLGNDIVCVDYGN